MGNTGRTYFTESGVRRLKPPTEGQKDHFEKLAHGLTLMLRVSYGGTKAWRVVWYEHGKPHVKTIGHWPAIGVANARKAARDFDPKAAKAAATAGGFKEVAEKWIKHHIDAKRLRSKSEIERHLVSFIYPRWARKPFFEIRRRTVNELLDAIVEKHGAAQADRVLGIVRGICNWYQTRDEDYVSPIVPGMRRDTRKAPEKARKRILADDEIRAVWKAADECGQFGAIVKMLLLTGQRREKVATMKWADITDDVWTIATEPREKGNAGEIRLPPMAIAVIEAQPEVVGNPFVFAGSESGRRHKTADRSRPPAFNSWSKSKARLDARLPDKMPPWAIHDLRRTARSLMSRAGVSRDHAERVLGHAIPGVEGVYDRHAYFEEKADALDRLAKLVETIINPPNATNVVPLTGRR